MRIDTYIKDFGIFVFAEYSRITQTTSLPLPIFPYQQGLFSFVFVFIFHSSLHIFLLFCKFLFFSGKVIIFKKNAKSAYNFTINMQINKVYLIDSHFSFPNDYNFSVKFAKLIRQINFHALLGVFIYGY